MEKGMKHKYELRNRVKVRLAELDMHQTDLAERLGVTKQTLNGWVKGRPSPSLLEAFVIAELLGCKTDDLWEIREKNTGL